MSAPTAIANFMDAISARSSPRTARSPTGNGGSSTPPAQKPWGMRVQARKVDFAKQKYLDLGHEFLMSDAKAKDLFAAYCFYNAWPKPKRRLTTTCPNFSTPVWSGPGITCAPAQSVKALIQKGETGLKPIMAVSQPWSCIVCSLPPKQLSLPARVRRALGIMAGSKAQSRKILLPELKGSAPDYVTQVLKRSLNAKAIGDRLKQIHPNEIPTPNVNGIIVIQERPFTSD